MPVKKVKFEDLCQSKIRNIDNMKMQKKLSSSMNESNRKDL